MSKVRICVLIVVFAMLAAAPIQAQTEVVVGSWTVHGWVQAMVDIFNATQDDIVVSIQPMAEYDDAVTIALATGTGPDIIFAPSRQMGWADTLVDLAPYWERSTVDLGEFIPNAFADASVGGKMFQVPFGTPYMRILYYVPSLFEEAGVVNPNVQHRQGEWTWDGFVTTAQRLTHDRDGDGVPEVYGTLWDVNWYRDEITAQADGYIVSDDGRTFTAHEPAFVEAVQWLADLGLVHGVNKAIEGGLDGGIYNGTVAITPYSTGGLGLMERSAEVEWDVAPFFNRPENRPFQRPPGWTAFGISPSSDNPDAAWRFVEFTLSYDAQVAMAMNGGDTPILIDALRSPDWLDRPGVHNLAYAMEQAMNQTALPTGARHIPAQIEDMVAEAVSAAARGEGAAATVLEQIAGAAQSLLDELQDQVILW